MNKKFSRMIEPNLQPVMACLVLFIFVTIPFQPILALCEGVAAVILWFFMQYSAKKRRRNIMQYVDGLTGGLDSASKNAVLNAPLPILVFRADSQEVIWCNDSFMEIAGQKDAMFIDLAIKELIPDFDCKWIMDNEKEAPYRVWLGERIYRVFGSTNHVAGKAVGENLLATTYWVDITETAEICDKYEESRPVVAILMIDNYEELMKAGGEASRSSVLAKIDEQVTSWCNGKNGLLRKYDRDKYLFVFEEQYFEDFVEDKFSLLDTVHEVTSEDGVVATLSIGIGKDVDSFEELFHRATKCIEMALSRGGDQAVVKDHLDFQFYGGKRQTTEKRTKVKSRVMAKALNDLVMDSTEVYVMGHQYADMDALGAACGIACIARKNKRKVKIVIDEDNNNANPLLRRLRKMPEYEDIFISGNDAFIHARPGALLVVVDTNRPDMVESEALLDSCNRVAVIDHHRRAANYIESAALNFHEPFASSASELVTELLQYIVEPQQLLKGEAEALLAGMVLDTKNFTMRTGSRTFEAAAFLRRCGGDTSEVSRLFQNDLSSMVQRYDIIRNARMYREDIAIAAAEKTCPRVVAAKAADDLLTLQGVQASIVVYCTGEDGENVGLSARSLGEVNVQLILEPLGGGGNSTTAGGLILNANVYDVEARLVESLNKYFDK